jgi:hypothetical protein
MQFYGSSFLKILREGMNPPLVHAFLTVSVYLFIYATFASALIYPLRVHCILSVVGCMGIISQWKSLFTLPVIGILSPAPND